MRALDQFAEFGYAGAYGAVDVLPVVDEFGVGQVWFFCDAVNDFDHLISCGVFCVLIVH